MGRRWAVLWVACVVGCFSDVPPGTSGGSTGSTACTPGEVLCECRPDDSCDAGLACVPEGCIPDDCDPGTPMCTCLQPGNVCVQGWICSEGLCREETSTTSGMTTTMPATTGTSVEPVTTTTEPPGTAASTIDPTSDGMETGPDDVGGVDCSAAGLCMDCAFCTLNNECKDEYDFCAADMGCVNTAMCIQTCLAGNPDMFEMCIMDCDCVSGGPPLADLIDCTSTVCDDACVQEIPCGS